jgi:hypothetical protein
MPQGEGGSIGVDNDFLEQGDSGSSAVAHFRMRRVL